MAHSQPTLQSQSASRARSRSPLSRPTTPLRPLSRSSLRNSQSNGPPVPIALDALEAQFAELSDSMADLEANFMHLQLMHESLSRFSESFASFLYGLNMNAFTIDFPEQPLIESIARWQRQQKYPDAGDTTTSVPNTTVYKDPDTTFMTGDASFASMKATPRRRTTGMPSTPKTTSTTATSTAGAKKSNMPSVAKAGNVPKGTRGISRGTRASGLPRGRPRGRS